MSKSESARQFSERLRYVARVKNITQIEVAKALGKYSSEINRWWQGEVMPRPNYIEAFTRIIGCNFEYLESGIGDPFPPQNSSPNVTASNGSTVIQAGRDATNISGNDQAIVLTDLEKEVILLNRDIGNKKLLKGFRKKLLEIQKISESF